MLGALFRLSLAGVAVAVSGLAAYELHDRYFSPALVLTVDPMETAQQLAAQDRWAETLWLADFIQDHGLDADPEAARRLSLTAQSRVSGVGDHAARFMAGAVTGEPADLAGLMGSLTLDLFVAGDIRDIAVQGWKQAQYGTGDEIILALSATGLVTTVAPHLDWAPALLKAFKRVGALNPRLIRTLNAASRQALASGDFTKLRLMVKDVGDAALRLGPGPLRGALPAVDSGAELSKLAAAAKVNPRDTYVLASLAGTRGIRRLDAAGGNVTRVVGSIKIGSRAVKAVKKITAAMSPGGLLMLLVVALLMLAWSLRPRRRRRKRRAPARRRIEPVLDPSLEARTVGPAEPAASPALHPLIR